MLNKSIALGFLAFGLMVAPTTAFAGQSQGNVQTTEQNGAATNGSTTAQSSESINNQVQSQINRARRNVRPAYGYGYGGYGGYRRSCSSGYTSQSQNSAQSTSQNGAATDGSTTAQSNNTQNHQSQSVRRGC